MFLLLYPVIRENKETTKVCPVFNTSWRGKSSPSLNNCLDPDPNFIPDIVEVLLRQLMFATAFVSHIAQAFLQIKLPHLDTYG